MARITRERASDFARFAEVAAGFARTLIPGDVVALSGPLGAGKTTFVAAAVHALHGTDEVTSPTFTFWHRYEGTPLIHHLDLYRVEDRRDLATLGLEEAFTPDALVFVEWPERAAHLLPPQAYAVTISGAGNEPRDIEISRP